MGDSDDFFVILLQFQFWPARECQVCEHVAADHSYMLTAM